VPWLEVQLTKGIERATRLYRSLKPLGYPGAYPTVQRWVKRWKDQQRQQATVRFETVPGQQAQVDWGEEVVTWTDGRQEKVYAFCAVLGYSRRRFVTYRRRCDLWALLSAHRALFEYFDGVPHEIVYDNAKTVVISRQRGTVRFHPTLLALAAHYGFTPFACQPYRPQTKGKTERVVGFVHHDFFVGRGVRDLADLNAQVLAWCAETDARVHGTTHERPAARWATEHAALRALPGIAFDLTRVEFRRVSRDCFISVDGNSYSAPWRSAGQAVTVKLTDTHLRIYQDTALLAEHIRQAGSRGAVVTSAAHFAGLRPRSRSPSPPQPRPPSEPAATVLAWAQRAFGVTVAQRPLRVYEEAIGLQEVTHG
jgi:transposase